MEKIKNFIIITWFKRHDLERKENAIMKKSQSSRSMKSYAPNGLSIPTAIMLLALVLLIVVGYTRLVDVREQTNRLNAEKVALTKERDALKEELDQIKKEANNQNSNVYIESVARTHLDMVYSDEIVFHVSDN